ncbi:MAG: hypothetical protein HY951_04140 [Bacteroidia bacterium]|nr:hypothetical protein [Bacteroidia bacterium]
MSKITPENIIINGLWIGKELSLLEILCIKSFIKNGHTFHLWLYQPLNNILPENVVCKDANTIIPENKIFRYKNKNQYGHGKGSLGGFSDIFRYKLLYEYGGWWTDMDITCIKPLNFEQEYVFRTHLDLKLVGILMKCPKHSELMAQCYKRAIAEINEENTDWNRPIQILVDEVKNYNLEIYIIELSNQDSWKLIIKLLKKDFQIPSKWHVIHWVNEEWKRNKIRKDYFIEDSTIHLLLQKNNIPFSKISLFCKICYRFNLLYLIAGLRQLPYFIKRKFN